MSNTLHTTESARILIVDDDSVTRLTLKKILVKEGYEVQEASTGESCLAMLENYSPQLVLLDVMMPGIDGYETCRRLRSKFDYNVISVIMLTGLDDVSSIDDAFETGANDFITKPINWPLLVRRVRYVIRDRQTQIDMVENEARLTQAQRIAKLAYWQLDINSQQMSYSEIFYEQFAGSDLSIHCFDDFLKIVHPEDRDNLRDKFSVLYQQDRVTEFDHRICYDGNEYIFHLNIEAVLDDSGELKYLRGTTQNITLQRNTETLINYHKYHNDLTGLPNKKYIIQSLTKYLLHSKADRHQTVILAIGMQRFKEINDSLGHQAGDRLVKSIADRLRSLSGNIFLGHYDSQIFVIIINNLERFDHIEIVLKEVQQTLITPYVINGQDIFVDNRIGISVFPLEEGDADTLIANAILALNTAEQSINDKICFHSPTMRYRAKKLRSIEIQIRAALENDQFRLFYQPQMDLATGRLVGAEALIRLKLNDKDWMSPVEFIPVAEETGLIISVGYWVIETACKQIRSWLDNGIYDLRVGINLSAKQFADPGLFSELDAIVNKYKLPSHCIDLEITESIALNDLDQTIMILQRFKQRGYSISLDDFGTGYSSLSSLHLLPIDIVKIDRAFIKDIGSNGQNGAMARTIINMAHNLNLSVIAEGAEDINHIEFLKANHCNEVQGFYYSRPLPADEFVEYYEQYMKSGVIAAQTNKTAS